MDVFTNHIGTLQFTNHTIPIPSSHRCIRFLLLSSPMESLALNPSLSLSTLKPTTPFLRHLTTTTLHHRPRHPPSSSPSPSISLSLPSFPKLPPKPRLTLKPFNAAAATTTTTTPPPPSVGAKRLPLILSISVGLILRFLIPKPPSLTPQAWQLLAIFLSTVAGLVLSPLPVGAWAFLGVTASVVTKTLPFPTAFSAFTNEVIWLIVISFFFARGFVKTGLGDRIATYFVKWLGKSTLGLSYGLTFSEALVAPAMPSTTARAGGIFLPIIKSLSISSGSLPGDHTSKKLGSYLVMNQLQVFFFFLFLEIAFWKFTNCVSN